MNFRKLILPLSAALLLSGSAFARPEAKDIVDTAVGAGSFKTLVSLVTKAGLVDTLKGEGPFTVLAPTDAAFAKLPKALVAKLVGNPELLKKVLLYHVISGKVMAADLKNGMRAKSVEGEAIKVMLKKSGVFFNKSKVVSANVDCTNGVIHAIDTVLLPPSVAKPSKMKHHG